MKIGGGGRTGGTGNAGSNTGSTGSTGEEVCVSITQADSGKLSGTAQAKVGDRPVYELAVTSGGKDITGFGGGKVAVSVAYTPSEYENPDKIVVYCTSASGALIMVPHCKYDKKTGLVTFKTTHFSNYAVGYNDANFNDVADTAWYAEFVRYIAARDIVRGDGKGLFSPEKRITRAEFVSILARISSDSLNGYSASPFADVKISDWYFRSVCWAYETGIAVGSDGKFHPEESISREQMATMLFRYSEYCDYADNSGYADYNSDIRDMPEEMFSDYNCISSWAQTPIRWAFNIGIISGNTSGSFNPQATATRAQSAKMIAILLQEMIKN